MTDTNYALKRWESFLLKLPLFSEISQIMESNINKMAASVVLVLLILNLQAFGVEAQVNSTTSVTSSEEKDICQNCTTTEDMSAIDNTTEISTTMLPNMTLTKLNTFSNNTDSTNAILKPQNNFESKEHLIDFCPCDLKINSCDINCCCDFDCSRVKKEVFSQCDDLVSRQYDTRLCDYVKYGYVNKSLSTWNVHRNNLFCVVATNRPKSFPVNEPLFTSLKKVDLHMLKQYSWNRSSISMNISRPLVKKFSYNDILWLMTEESSVIEFGIPTSFITMDCNLKSTVKYLKNMKSKCLRHLSISGEADYFVNWKSYFENIKIIGVTYDINSTVNLKYFKKCPRNICIAIQPQICNQNYNRCDVLLKNNTLEEQHNLILRNKIYYNAVKKVRYEIYHNGTNGILEVHALFVFENINLNDLPQSKPFMQEFEVFFYWYNETGYNLSAIRSGNPGYFYGNPILIGNFMKRKMINSTSFDMKILRNSTGIIDNFFVLPKPKNGICVLDNLTNTIINFGYNLRVKCKIIEKLEKVANVSATSVCRYLQTKIFRYWSVRLNVPDNSRFCKWGNANVSHLQDWKEFTYNPKPMEVVAEINGSLIDRWNQTLHCSGLVTGLSINVFHYRYDFDTLKNQERILGISYNFDYPKNISFADITDVNKIISSVESVMDVNFFDVTGKKRRKYMEPPSLEFKLPYDFFYPFVKIGNRAASNDFQYLCVIVFCVVIIFSNC